MQLTKQTIRVFTKKELLEAVDETYGSLCDTEIILGVYKNKILLYGERHRNQKDITLEAYDRAFKKMKANIRKAPAKQLF